MAAEDILAQGLCGVMEKALVGEGVPPAVARALAMRACEPTVRSAGRAVKKKAKKTASAASKKAKTKYSRAFAKVKGKYQTKSGKWKKDGFKRAVRAAHKLAKTMR